jgi:hypothetical protein
MKLSIMLITLLSLTVTACGSPFSAEKEMPVGLIAPDAFEDAADTDASPDVLAEAGEVDAGSDAQQEEADAMPPLYADVSAADAMPEQDAMPSQDAAMPNEAGCTTGRVPTDDAFCDSNPPTSQPYAWSCFASGCTAYPNTTNPITYCCSNAN